MRDQRLAETGFAILRMWNTEVEDNLEGVIETVIHHARERMNPKDSVS